MVQNGPAADQRRREILGAASRLFRERGLHATGMREIAAALDMTAGNLYYYFPSKQDLLAFCQEETLGQLLRRAREIRRSPQNAGEKLRLLVEGHVAVLNEETPGSLAHLEVNEVPAALRAPLLARRKSYEAAIRELIEEGIGTGEFRKVDARLATLALLGALNWTVKWFQPAGRKSAPEVGREFADLLLAGLLRPAASKPRRSSKGKDPAAHRLAEGPSSRSRRSSRRIPAGGGGAAASAAQRQDRRPHAPPPGRNLADGTAEVPDAERHRRRPILPFTGSLRHERAAARKPAKRPGVRLPGPSTDKDSAAGKKRK